MEIFQIKVKVKGHHPRNVAKKYLRIKESLLKVSKTQKQRFQSKMVRTRIIGISSPTNTLKCFFKDDVHLPMIREESEYDTSSNKGSECTIYKITYFISLLTLLEYLQVKLICLRFKKYMRMNHFPKAVSVPEIVNYFICIVVIFKC